MYGMLYNPIHRLHRQNFSYLVRNNFFLYIFYRSALFSEDSNNVLVTTIDDK